MSDLPDTPRPEWVEITCPLCGEGDFDAIGFVGHIETPGWCEGAESAREGRLAERQAEREQYTARQAIKETPHE